MTMFVPVGTRLHPNPFEGIDHESEDDEGLQNDSAQCYHLVFRKHEALAQNTNLAFFAHGTSPVFRQFATVVHSVLGGHVHAGEDTRTHVQGFMRQVHTDPSRADHIAVDFFRNSALAFHDRRWQDGHPQATSVPRVPLHLSISRGLARHPGVLTQGKNKPSAKDGDEDDTPKRVRDKKRATLPKTKKKKERSSDEEEEKEEEEDRRMKEGPSTSRARPRATKRPATSQKLESEAANPKRSAPSIGLVDDEMDGAGSPSFVPMRLGLTMDALLGDKRLKKAATDDLRCLSLNVTGASVGDVVVGIRSNSAKDSDGGPAFGLVFQVVEGEIRGGKKTWDAIKGIEDATLTVAAEVIKHYPKLGSAALLSSVAGRLSENGSDSIENLDGHQAGTFKIRLLSAPQSLYTLLGDEVVREMLHGEPVDPHAIVQAMIESSHNKNESERFLTFQKQFLRLERGPLRIDTFPATRMQIFDLVDNCWITRPDRSAEGIAPPLPNGREAFVMSEFDQEHPERQVCVLMPCREPGQSGNVQDYVGEVVKHLDFDEPEVQHVHQFMDLEIHKFAFGMKKSLLQKIVRFQAPEVTNVMREKGVRYSSRVAAVATALSLLTDAGCFIPDIHRFMGGVEAFAKRAGVIWFEDSFLEDAAEFNRCFGMMLGALFGRASAQWRPPPSLAAKWMENVLTMLMRPKAHVYSHEHGGMEDRAIEEHFTANANADMGLAAENCAVALRILGSFQGDHTMFRDIVWRTKNAQRIGPEARVALPHDGQYQANRNAMDVSHCLDQHCTSRIMYMLPSKYIRDQNEGITLDGKPYSRVMRSFFSKVTGLNPRREPVNELYRGEFVETVQHIQRLAMLLYFGSLRERHASPVSTLDLVPKEMGFECPDMWLAYLVGAREVNVDGTPMTCFLKATNPTQIIAQSSKKDASGASDNAKKAAAVQTFGDTLAAGVRIRAADANGCPLDNLVGKTVSRQVLDTGEVSYFIEGNTWPSVRKSAVSFLPTQEMRGFVEEFVQACNPLSYSGGNGVTATTLLSEAMGYACFSCLDSEDEKKTLCEDFGDCLDLILNSPHSFSSRALARLDMYLASARKTFHIASISKEGGASNREDIPTGEDADVFKIMVLLCAVAPLMVKLDMSRAMSFRIVSPAVVLEVRDRIHQRLSKVRQSPEQPGSWGRNSFVDDRPDHIAFDYQEECANEMLDNHIRLNMRHHYLRMDGGTGKTHILALFLHKLREYCDNPDSREHFPEYIVYIAPSGAIGTITEHMRHFRVPVNEVVPLANRQVVFKPRHVNLIRTNHVRMTEALNKHEGHRLDHIIERAILVVDEAHKQSNAEAQQTAATMALARRCREMVCMTGTPIRSRGMHDLKGYLDLITGIPTTTANFWVAASAMVSRFAKPPARRVDILVTDVDWKEEERTVFQELMPIAFGGTRRPGTVSQADMKRAIELMYEVCTRTAVRIAIERRIEFGKAQPVVARNHEHAQAIKAALEKEGADSNIPGVNKYGVQVHIVDGRTPFSFSPESESRHHAERVEEARRNGRPVPKPRPTYDFIVLLMTVVEGYDLHACDSMIRIPYPAGQDRRVQLEWRINRTNQESPTCTYIVVSTGLLNDWNEKHAKAGTLDNLVKMMFEEAKKQVVPPASPVSRMSTSDDEDDIPIASKKATAAVSKASTSARPMRILDNESESSDESD